MSAREFVALGTASQVPTRVRNHHGALLRFDAEGLLFDPDLAELGIAGPDVGRLQREGRLVVDGRAVTLEAVSEPRPGQRVAFVMDTRRCAGASALAEGPTCSSPSRRSSSATPRSPSPTVS